MQNRVLLEEKDQKSKRDSANKIQQHIIQFLVHTHVQCLMILLSIYITEKDLFCLI